MKKYQSGGRQSCVTAGGCSKPAPILRAKPEVERIVAAGIDRQTRGNESERRRLYQSAGIPYQSVAASTRPARTFDTSTRPTSTLTQTNRVVKTKPKVTPKAEPKKEEPKSKTWDYYYGSTPSSRNLMKSSTTKLTDQEESNLREEWRNKTGFYKKGGTIKKQTMKNKPAPKKKMSAKEMEAMKKAKTPMMKHGGKMGKKPC